MVRNLQALTVALGLATALVAGQIEQVYWVSEAASTCASSQARFSVPGGQRLIVNRANASQPCILAVTEKTVTSAASEVVLLKQESIAGSLLAQHAQSWTERLADALSQSLSDSSQLTFQNQESVEPEVALGFRYQQLTYAHDHFLFVAVDEDNLSILDKHVTFDTRLQRAIFRSAPEWKHIDEGSEKPEPEFKRPRFNTVVDSIASSSALSPARIMQDLRVLTGEGDQPKDVGQWRTRHSSTHGARLAAHWIKQQLESSLSSINGSTCSFFEYSPFFAPNVVCNIPSSAATLHGHELNDQDNDDAEMVLISAHLDSRGTFGETTAPGGDDDGSGTAALLAIARAVGNAGVQFQSPVQLVAFSGEEQGLVGSQKYAQYLHDHDVRIRLAVQMDMLAYRKPGEPLQIAFPDKLSTKSATAHITAIAELYAPELEPGFTPACCSDHQSFWEQGYPATWVFERNGPIADPMYHNSGDLTNRTGYDVTQLAAIAKVVTATLLNVAGFYM